MSRIQVWFTLGALVIIATLRAATTPSSSAGFVTAPPAAWVESAELPPAGPPRDNPSGQDFLLLDRQTRVSTEESYFRRAYQIVSEAGRQHGAQVTISFDPSYQSLTLHHLRLVRDGEVLDRLDPSKIQILQQERDLDRQLYNGERSAFAILDDVRIGDVVDLAFTVRGTNPVFGDRFIDSVGFGWGVPVRDLRYRLIAPKGSGIAAKLHGVVGVEKTMAAFDDDEEIQWWRAHSLPRIEGEDRTPADTVVFPYLELSAFRTWNEVVDWALPLYALAPEAGPLVKEMAARLRSSGPSPEARALAALDFVQQEIRYLGIEMGAGSHRPSDPEEVLRRRFGDCKDKARLLVALLRELGVQAVPALVNSSVREYLHQRLPTPYAFDHVVVHVDLDGTQYLVDPTVSHQRGASLALRHLGSYRTCLPIVEGSGRLATVVHGPGDLMRTVVRETFTIEDLDQSARFKVITEYSGASARSIRSYLTGSSREQIGRDYLDYYHSYYPGITLDGEVSWTDDAAGERVVVTENYRIKDLFSAATDTNPVQVAEFHPAAIWDQVRTPNLSRRKFPFRLSHPVHLEQQLDLHLPSDWPIERTLDRVEDAAFELEVGARGETPRHLVLSHVWKSRADAVAPDRIDEFAANLQRAKDQLGYQLTHNTAIASSGPYPLNWPMVGLAGLMLASGAFAANRALRPAGDFPPPLPAGAALPSGNDKLEGLGGWLILVGFGVLLRPVVYLVSIVQGHQAYFNQGVWSVLTTPGTDTYRPLFSLLAPLELGLNILLFVYSVTLILLFFRRSRRFPGLIQILLMLEIAAMGFSAWSSHALGPVTDAENTQVFGDLFRSMLVALIWVPYFRLSRRVALTFTR